MTDKELKKYEQGCSIKREIISLNEVLKALNNKHYNVTINVNNGVLFADRFEINLGTDAFSKNFKEIITKELNSRITQLEKEFAEL